MRKLLKVIPIILLLGPTAIVFAEDGPPGNPISRHSEFRFDAVKKIVLRTADLMPEEKYDFRPADEVRTFGQILGHVADSQYFFCSSLQGEEFSSRQVEKTKTSKAEIIAALEQAFAYCASSYTGLTDVTGGETVKLFGDDTPKLSVLDIDQTHTIEHYGNLIVYLRMNGIVPPTSDPEFMAQLRRE